MYVEAVMVSLAINGYKDHLITGRKGDGEFDLYRDIAKRTDGDIYIGVVGPVRTGKSTLIKRIMDLLVLPNIENEHKRREPSMRCPQSGAGRTIMTTQPKFVPDEAIEITIRENANLKIRMVDCVGYLVNGAMGHMEGDSPGWFALPGMTMIFLLKKPQRLAPEGNYEPLYHRIGVLPTGA